MSDQITPLTLGRSVPAVADQPPSATRSLTDDFKLGPHLPDLGADVRMQPGLPSLPVVIRAS